MTTESTPSRVQQLLARGYWIDALQVLLAVAVVVIGCIVAM